MKEANPRSEAAVASRSWMSAAPASAKHGCSPAKNGRGPPVFTLGTQIDSTLLRDGAPCTSILRCSYLAEEAHLYNQARHNNACSCTIKPCATMCAKRYKHAVVGTSMQSWDHIAMRICTKSRVGGSASHAH